MSGLRAIPAVALDGPPPTGNDSLQRDTATAQRQIGVYARPFASFRLDIQTARAAPDQVGPLVTM
ncbi:MAG: hypothetical protein MUQ27_11810, partial [Acidimicrobiia bacterium]|nr:hypothetical protein [Acidimicrobiia bacterium]